MSWPKASSEWTIRRFLGKLASPEPTPGGGSAAAVAGALGSALVGMVGSILLIRPRLKRSTRRKLRQHVLEANRASQKLQELIQEDALSYQVLVRAQRFSKGISAARKRAVHSPVRMCELCLEGLVEIKQMAPLAGPYLGADLKAARALLKGSFEAAYATAMINLEGPALSLSNGPDPSGWNRTMRDHLARL